MISAQEFHALVATYREHGWVLRQVVLAANSEALLKMPPEVAVRKGVVDAAWFSRPPKPGSLPWEIRHLGSTPYALVEHLDEDSDDFAQRLHQTEERLADTLNAKQKA